MRHRPTVVALVVTLAVGGFIAPVAAVGTGPNAASTAAAPVTGVSPQQSSAVCDYVELYNRTIPSVVMVQRSAGQGSGFAFEITDNGTAYLVTNAHVLGNVERVRVRFRGGELRTGVVVGTEPAADLGVVRVNRTPDYLEALPVAETAPRPGRKVAAFGHPFGLRGTITQGIVSNVDQSVPTQGGFTIPDVIQTDAAINPGNSGGPLVTCDRTVVGVNTAAAPAGTAENIGFAVSAQLVNRVVPELIENGEFAFPYLGVQTVPVSPAIRRANDLDVRRGVMVVEVVEDAPADGVLQPADAVAVVGGQQVPVGGDVIVAIGGQPVRTTEDLSSYLATEAAPDQSVNVTVIRNGTRQNVTVTLGERPESPMA